MDPMRGCFVLACCLFEWLDGSPYKTRANANQLTGSRPEQIDLHDTAGHHCAGADASANGVNHGDIRRATQPEEAQHVQYKYGITAS